MDDPKRVIVEEEGPHPMLWWCVMALYVVFGVLVVFIESELLFPHWQRGLL